MGFDGCGCMLAWIYECSMKDDRMTNVFMSQGRRKNDHLKNNTKASTIGFSRAEDEETC